MGERSSISPEANDTVDMPVFVTRKTGLRNSTPRARVMYMC